MPVRWGTPSLPVIGRNCGLALLLVAPGAVCAQRAAPPLASAAAPLVFQGVTVIDVREGRLLPNRVVTIVGNRIQAVETADRARAVQGARVVDARGKYLIPGLWDMHVHPMQYVDIAYPLFIANGVTGVRDAGSNVPLATLVQWKREIAAGTRVGPRLLVSGPQIHGPQRDRESTSTVTQGDGTHRHQIYVPLAVASRVVDSLQNAGADVLKFYSMPDPVRWALAAEARRVGIRFGGHAEGVGQAFADSGATFLDHVTWFKPNACGDFPFDPVGCAAAVERLWRNHTWIVATGGLAEASWERTISQVLRYKPDSVPGYATVLERFKQDSLCKGNRAMLDSLAALHEPTSTGDLIRLLQSTKEGQKALDERLTSMWAQLRAAGIHLPILAGTDVMLGVMGFYAYSRPGFQLPEALVAYVLRGMTPLQALQTATLNPALALHATDSLGTVEAEKIADLVLLDADPLADVWNTTKIRAVIANGRYYDRPALDRLLAQTEQAARRAPPP